MRRGIDGLGAVLGFALLAMACLAGDASTSKPAGDGLVSPTSCEVVLAHDDFSALSAGSLADRWIVEQRPGGSVGVSDDRLVIDDTAGCTVWWRTKLTAPVTISFDAVVTSKSRVSDLNCFWMASDPARPGDLFAPGNPRDGRFASYDTLVTYYVGYGGNDNSTTRFRRYDGTGARPLLPEHDLRAPEFLLVPDRTYSVKIIAADGHARYLRDGEVIFDFTDPEPLSEGWFGFRTVKSRIEIRNFRITKPASPDSPPRT